MSKAPSDMFFESEVRPEYEGRLLLDSLCDRFTYHSREDWIDRLTRGLVTINGATANVETIAHRGDKVVYHVENYSEPEVPTDFETVFEDDEFILVAKPAGVPVHHTGRIFYNTFAAIIRREFDSETATPMHRLDRDTGGLILFARYGETAARFQKNLDRILLRKFYLAVVRGNFPEGEVECHMPLREDPEDSIRLRMHHRADGKECFTRFKLVRRLDCPEIAPELSLVEAELITGRKHQIRAHLAEMGYPIVGDRLYYRDGAYYEKLAQGGELTDEDIKVLGARNQMLFAYKVELQLPYWKEPRVFESHAYPEDMAKLLSKNV